MALNTNMYVFGPFRLDLEKRVILCNERPACKAPLRFGVMKALIDAAPSTVTCEELMRNVWVNQNVTARGVRRVLVLRFIKR